MAATVSAPTIVFAKPFATVEELVARLTDEGLIGSSAAAKLFGSPRAGRPRHPSWVGRQCLEGARLSDGSVLKLEHVRLAGGAIATSKPAVLRFISALQQPAATAVPVRTPTARERASLEAAAELERMGV